VLLLGRKHVRFLSPFLLLDSPLKRRIDPLFSEPPPPTEAFQSGVHPFFLCPPLISGILSSPPPFLLPLLFDRELLPCNSLSFAFASSRLLSFSLHKFREDLSHYRKRSPFAPGKIPPEGLDLGRLQAPPPSFLIKPFSDFGGLFFPPCFQKMIPPF